MVHFYFFFYLSFASWSHHITLSLFNFLFPSSHLFPSTHISFLLHMSLSPLFLNTICLCCWGKMGGSNLYVSMNSLWTLVIMDNAWSYVILATSKILFYNCNLVAKSIKLSTTKRLWSSMIRSWGIFSSLYMTSKWGINNSWIKINLDLMVLSAT